ncbi:hypothetical protein Q3G72_027212 [Acer saccharum]|nr:hypothetical protein Q3G72_027212 [Acer saccharum]
MFSTADPMLANCYVKCGKFEDVLLLLIVVLFVDAKSLFMTWVAAAAAVAYMAKFWQNLSRDKNSSLSVLSVGKVSVEWLAGEKTKVEGTFPPKKMGWTGYVEKDTAGSSSDGAENTAAVAADIALISIAAASSVLLQILRNPWQLLEILLKLHQNLNLTTSYLEVHQNMAEEVHRKYEFIYPPDGSWDHTPVKAESDSPEDQIFAVYENQLTATEGFHAQLPAEPDIPDACYDWIMPDEVDSKWTIKAANAAIKKFNELKGADLKLIDIKDSNSQMVAGLIHFLTLQCSDGHIYEAKIYMPITGDCELYIFRPAKYWPWPRKDKNKNEEGDAEHEGSKVIGKKRKE